MKISFVYSSSVFSCQIFSTSFASLRSIPFLSIFEPIFAWNVSLESLIFKRSLVFPILLFSSIFYIDHWGRLSYLSLIFIGTLHSNGYTFPSLLFWDWNEIRACMSCGHCWVFQICWHTESSSMDCFAFRFSPLPLDSLLSQLFVRPPQTTILPFCISLSWGWSWSLPPIQCHEPLQALYQI